MSQDSNINFVENLIIGAGPCGIGAAHRLKSLNKDFLVIEKNKYVGGLATSFVDQKGFTWDIGGHVQFSHYKYFDQAMIESLGEQGWLHHQRESWVWMHKRFIPYPFQNNIHRLPDTLRDECLSGLENNQHKSSSNFKEWILKNFGEGISKHFLLPYNFKVWAYTPEKMNSSWVGERVSTIDINRIKENIKLNRDDVSWGPNSTFQFPKEGGTGAIWESLANKIGIDSFKTNSNVIKINTTDQYVIYLNSKNESIKVNYKNLISTIPINKLCSIVDEVEDQLTERSNELKYSTSHIVGIGLKGKIQEELSTKCWMYFPESDCPFYRVTVFSNYSPNNVPNIKENFSLMTETSESSDKPVDAQTLVDQTIEGLIKTKLITSQDEVVSTWHFKAKYGYPTPSLDRDHILKEVITKLESLGVQSRGRFGAWKYEISNQDHTFMQGVEWVEKKFLNKEETTFKL